ncbi:hypothetical protein IH799_08535, partial [candidate division KSB1 bacterium]|nr:hypothetical protein [candidate division KSB1 bacterium]
MSEIKKIAIIPGDGIGIDVTHEAMKVLEVIQNTYNLPLDVKHFDYGADRYLKDGTTMPEDQVEEIDAVNNPEDPDLGTRKAPFSRVLYIEKDDFREDPPPRFFRLAPGREV